MQKIGRAAQGRKIGDITVLQPCCAPLLTTVVFADLVGSTGIFERLGDATASRFVTQLTTALSKTFESHHGRVVKLLGDGLFVIFPLEADALAACVAIQTRLHERPLYPGAGGDAAGSNTVSGTVASNTPVQMQFGVESGEVVEIEGDCFGDAVNSAARLADLAGADQILTTRRVFDALPGALRGQLRSLGPLFLRGKTDATEVFRLQWKTDADMDATVMGASLAQPQRAGRLHLSYTPPTQSPYQAAGEAAHSAYAPIGDTTVPGGHPAPQPQQVSVAAPTGTASLGRAANGQIIINDSRVSRLHCSVSWRGAHWVIADASSFGTWVYAGAQTEGVALRRGECQLVGSGYISLGCERSAEAAPLVRFRVDETSTDPAHGH